MNNRAVVWASNRRVQMAKKHSELTGADLHDPKGIDALNTSTALVMSQSAQTISISGSALPNADDTYDLGASGTQWKDLYIDGTANIDSLTLTSGATVTAVLDEDAMGSDSATSLATQQSIKAYVTAQITAEDLDVTSDSGTIAIDLNSETLSIAGGTGISTSATGNEVTITSAVTAGDGLTLTSADIDIDASQTTLTSILNSALVTGRDSDNQIKYSTDDQIIFRVAGGDGVTFKASGEIEATSLDIGGDADIDGTLEADAITVDSVALNEYIADTVGAMVGSNTETNITVTYEDSDNTLDFVIGTLNQDTSGTAAIATTVTISDNESTNEENAILFSAGADADGGNLGVEQDHSGMTYNPSTGGITATLFTGAVTGNASTATKIASITNSNIVQLTETQTLTNKTLTSPTLTGPVLGTPASGTMTNVNGTSGITGLGTQSQDLEMGGQNIQTVGVITLKEQAEADADVAGEGQIWVDTATPNVLYFTDDAGTDFRLSYTNTGTGNNVLATSPTLVTPALGTPSALVGTNISGTASSLTSGKVTVTDSTANTAFAIPFHDGSNALLDDTGTFTYNPSTAILSATSASFSYVTASVLEVDASTLTIGGVEIDATLATNLQNTSGTNTGDQDLWDVVAGDSGTTTSNSATDTLTIAGGTGITTAVSGDTLTVTSAITAGDGLTLNTADIDIDAAQTTITSLLATDIKIGEDDQTKIDFETADEIHFYANNTEQVYVGDNILGPQSDSDVDLGSTGVRWKDAYVDSITVTGEVDGASLDIEGDADINGTLEADAITVNGTALNTVIAGVTVSNATLAATTTVTDSTANTNFPIVLHNESNALLDDTGTFTYNPSTSTLVVPNINVSGTQTFVDTATLVVTSSIIFEGATDDGYETTLTVTDPTNDRTWTLQNATDTVVGRATTDTLTNKTINSNANTLHIDLDDLGTFTGTLAEFNSGLQSDSFVSLTGTETLTNKTLTSPVLTTPALGTPASGVGTNLTGTASSLNIGGTAELATTVTVSANNSTNESVYPVFVDGATGTQGLESDTGLSYNPQTGVLTVGSVVGSLEGSATSITVSAVSDDDTVYPVFVTTTSGANTPEVASGLSYNPSTGLLTLVGLDIGGDVDVDGTLETDALTIGGTTSVAFESGDHSKLDGIESSADVTDSTNVTAAGALMDSELSGITHVKALNQSVVSGATPTFTTTNFTDATNKRLMTDAQETKLDSVESSADVTDTTNVTAAGALMDSELTTIALVKGLTAGISDGNVLTANDAVADNDFLRINGTEVEGLTVAEVLSALSVESGATADQSNAEIVAAVEAGSDSNTFTDADHSKLNAIEASADVTDTTNVTAAGALMDSELAGIAAVKATTGTFLSADESKLDGIEASADVTDTANVTSAGALMDSELSNLAAVKAINQGLTTSSNVTFNDFRADSIGVGLAATSTTGRIDATNDVVAFSSSDKRWKENIIRISDPLEKIGKIGGYEFDWKELTEEEKKTQHGNTGHDVGVIAQEIQEVLPEVVKERDNGYLGVDYEKIVPLLIEAIKEQQKQIDELRKTKMNKRIKE